MKNSTLILVIWSAVLLLMLQSCNVKKLIPEGKLLYTGAEIKLENPKEITNTNEVKSEVESVIMPEPNGKFLGMRPALYFHYKAQKENPGFINRFFNKRFGEEPVYVSDVELDEVEEIIMNRLENRGYFYSRVSSKMNFQEEQKEASATYSVELAEPYVLANDSYEVLSDSIQLYREIMQMKEASFIEPNMRFDLTAFKAERERIEQNLKQKGYYNFNPRFLIFEADTNQYNNKKFDLYLRLKKEVPIEAAIPYRVERVNIYPNYKVDHDSVHRDTLRFKEKYFIQSEEFFKPKRLAPYVLIDEGELYSPQDSRYTSRRLTSIGAYKFVNIVYNEIDSLSTDSVGALEANIYLSPLTKRAIRAELQAVAKSNDFIGPKLALTYTNRNLFGGGEILNLSGTFGYEWQMASGDNRSLSSIQLGAEGDLIFPRMLFPVEINTDWFRYSIPKTRIGLGVNYLSRTELFQMYSTTAKFGYIWRSNRYITHQLDPLSINYVNLSKVTPEFGLILEDNPYLQNSFEQQFIAGLLYSFTYNGMVDEGKKHQFFVNANLDVAGNIVGLLSGGSNNDNEEKDTFLGLEYAQYLKLDADLRYHWNLTPNQTIATRLFGGYGMPYGNSDVMPFSKQYFSGGPYSVRAFRIRGLGPGSYDPNQGDDGAYFDQAGNIRLEANIEYRYPIFNFLKGAVFADAGNVWNTGDVDYVPGGKFSSDWFNEIGVGIGTGLRIDIQSFVIRFDLAFPMRTPWLDEGERWNYDFGSPVLNFGIGYPF